MEGINGDSENEKTTLCSLRPQVIEMVDIIF